MHEITLVTPFPIGEGAGGWGAGKQAKGRVGKRQKNTPPAGYSGGKVGGRQTGQAPGT